MVWFTIFAYTFFVYGISVIFTQSVGPANIFFRLRMWAEDIGSNFGLLFKCMTCFPTNVGWVFSLFNWFIVPQIPISPFNIILRGTNLWWLAMILDACYCAGVCHILWNIDDYIDKNTPIYEDEPPVEDELKKRLEDEYGNE